MRPGSGFCALMLPRIRPYRLCVARFELKEHKPPDKPGAPVQPFLIAVMQPGRVGKGISAQASHRTVLESLPSHGSCYPNHST